MDTLGGKLRVLRKQKRLTMKQVGEKFGIAESTISSYETGTRKPSLNLIREFAEFYDTSVDDLLNNSSHIEKDNIDNPYELSHNLSYQGMRNSSSNTPLEIEDLTRVLGQTVIPMGELVMIPVVAEIPCGEPVFTTDNVVGMFPVDTALIPNIKNTQGEYVYVRAKGDSMVGAGIMDGSMVLLQRRNTCDNGDIAAVCVDGECATLKRVFIHEDTITLVAENPSFHPMVYPVNTVRIVAVAVWYASRLK